MFRTAIAAVAVLFGMAACTPDYNWREAAVDEAGLRVLLPCKPDRGERTVDLGGRPLRVGMLGCEAGGAMFAVAHAQVPAGTSPDALLAAWRAVTLSNMHAPAATPVQAFVPAGALALGGSVRLQAEGMRPQGGTVHAQAAWFARTAGAVPQVFQAVVYSDRPVPAQADTFFGGLELK